MPDDTVLVPIWKDGPPGDHEPGVELFGFSLKMYDGRPVSSRGRPAVGVKVGLFYLNEDG